MSNMYSYGFCEDGSIHMQHSIPYTPQQNRVTEMKNRSLKDMDTCMMESKNLPPNFGMKK